MVPTLFRCVFQDCDIGSLSRVQAKTKVHTDVLDELQYADDVDKNISSVTKIQGAVNQVSQSCDNFDVTVNTKRKRLYKTT